MLQAKQQAPCNNPVDESEIIDLLLSIPESERVAALVEMAQISESDIQSGNDLDG